MKFGFFLPQVGTAASADGIVQVAKRAEALGYDSLWVTERLLWPVEPQTLYAGTMPIPEPYKIVLDPLQSLTWAAAATSRIRLGTSILVIGFYNPVLMARSLTTLDILSGGRLQVGLGQGWSQDEFDAAGGSMKDRGGQADEFIQALKAIWTTDPVEFKGKYFQIPKSVILPKPVQKPHPPIYLAAYSPSAMQRIATMADGWNPVGVPMNQVQNMLGGIKQMADQAGRNGDELKVLIRANVNITDQSMGDDRWPFNGSLEQIKQDIKAAEETGADELIFDPTFSQAGATVDGFLKTMELVRS
jgi:probable F420-dependent oxidoreductase